MYYISGIEEGRVKVFFRTNSIRVAERMMETITMYPGVTSVQLFQE